MRELDVPGELVRDIADSNTILFLGDVPGWRRSGDLPGPTEVEIANRLRELGGYADLTLSLAEIAQRFEQDLGRNALIQAIADLVDDPQFVQ